MGSQDSEEEFAICVECANPIEKCVCVCPYCGERDKCSHLFLHHYPVVHQLTK